MPDLKLDLINHINNSKYYDEIELIRLGTEEKMNYEEKVTLMAMILKKISGYNAQLALIDFYFQAQAPTQAPVEEDAPTQAPALLKQDAPPLSSSYTSKPIQGQSHGE